MKTLSVFTILSICIVLGVSCGKQSYDPPKNYIDVLKRVQFELYTDKDQSGDNSIIVFTVFIKRISSEILWDSTFSPMRVKDIPNLLHKIIVEKSLLVKDTSLLKAGFLYSIENTAHSGHADSLKIGETFKIVDFNFQ